MSKHYGEIAFTDAVRDVQNLYGSGAFYTARTMRARADERPDALAEDEREFIGQRDGFYLATVSATGWPYIQFRGGPPGFLHVIDDRTLGWADFQGNLQYISTGNLAGEGRVALFAMDYAHRRRLKIYGHARVVKAEDDPDLIAALADPGYEAKVERAVVVRVDAFDWNCPQHITPRFTATEIESGVAASRSELAALRAENAELRQALQAKS